MAGGYFSAIFESMCNSPALAGVNQLFGEAEVYNALVPPPRVVWEPPDAFTYGPPEGYAGDGLNNPRVIGTRLSNWKAHFWACATQPDGTPDLSATTIDNYDAAENLEQNILQALRIQMGTGFFYKAKGTSWKKNDGQATKFGRAGVILIEFHIPVTMPVVAEATIKVVTITTASINPLTGVETDNV